MKVCTTTNIKSVPDYIYSQMIKYNMGDNGIMKFHLESIFYKKNKIRYVISWVEKNKQLLSWGMLTKYVLCKWVGCFYTPYKYRRNGYAALIHNTLKKKIKKFIVLPCKRNKVFFKKLNYDISNVDRW